MYATIDGAWSDLMVRARSSPIIESRVGPMREMTHVQFMLMQTPYVWLCNEGRKLSRRYMCGELAWYLSGSDDVEFMTHYAKQYARFGEDNGHAWGAYGKRWNPQWDGLFDELQQPNTRRAVLTAYAATDTGADKRDIPCTLSLHFLPRDGCLNLITTMRSNDLWLGMPYDVFAFMTIQKLIAYTLGLEMGWYVHQVGSMHLYESDLPKFQLGLETEPVPFEVTMPFDTWVDEFTTQERKHREEGQQPTLTGDPLMDWLLAAL